MIAPTLFNDNIAQKEDGTMEGCNHAAHFHTLNWAQIHTEITSLQLPSYSQLYRGRDLANM